jgi:fermentation-respiration switch protein FrsA (DUF1100 family)
MAALKWLAIFIVVGYGGMLALLYFAQRSLMYFPDRDRTAPAAAGLPQAQEISLDTTDGEKLIAWHVPPQGEKPLVLYFHGNGGALNLRAARFRALVADGTGLVALSYRGYGGSSGAPTESGLIADARAAYDFAVKRYGAGRLVLWGESLGSGVAVALAAEQPVAKLILESPFSSAADVAAAAYPFVPARLLLKDQFRSDVRITGISVPMLVVHGARDNVVRIEFATRLYDLIRAPKRFVRLAEAGHNDHDAFGMMEIVRNFLDHGRKAPG